MTGMTRRDFLKRSRSAALAAGLAPAFSVGALGAKERIVVSSAPSSRDKPFPR